MKKPTKNEQKKIDRYAIDIKSMPNEEIIEICLLSAQGDDHNGGFTSFGWGMYQVELDELTRRLKNIGWLKQDFEILG